LDNNSYDSGDWFNKLDFSYQSDNWGTGLPIASQNQGNWPIMEPLLANSALTPQPSDIAHARDAFREFLEIRGPPAFSTCTRSPMCKPTCTS